MSRPNRHCNTMSPFAFVFCSFSLGLRICFVAAADLTRLDIPVVSPRLTTTIQLTSSSQGAEITTATPLGTVNFLLFNTLLENGPTFWQDCTALSPDSAARTSRGVETATFPNATLQDLLAHVLVIDRNSERLACVNLIPDSDDDHVKFDAFYTRVAESRTLFGSAYVFVLADRLSILAELRASDDVGDAETDAAWSLSTGADACASRQAAQPQSSASSALRVGSRAIVSVRTSALQLDRAVLTLYQRTAAGYEPVSCTPLQPVLAQTARTGDRVLRHRTPFHLLRVETPLLAAAAITESNCSQTRPPESLGAEALVVDGEQFVSKWSLFGENSLFLRSLVVAGNGAQCDRISGVSGKAVAATFLYPIVGKLTFVDVGGGATLVFGTLRHMFAYKPSVAPWKLIEGPLPDGTNPFCDNIDGTTASIDHGDLPAELQVAAYNASADALYQAFTRWTTRSLDFSKLEGGVVRVDVDWTVGCATLRPAAALEGRAELRRYGVQRAPVVGSVAFSQQIDGRTVVEVAVDGADEFDLKVHANPIDLSQTDSHPCGWQSVGPDWPPGTQIMQPLLAGIEQDGEATHSVDSALLSSPLHSFLSKTIHLSSDSQLLCGTVTPAVEPTATALATFDAVWLTGYVQIIEYSEFRKTVVISGLKSVNGSAAPTVDLRWDIEDASSACGGGRSTPYNPFYVGANKGDNAAVCQRVPDLCAVGDLSAKVGAPSVDQRRAFVAQAVPLSADNSVLGKWLVIRDGVRVACATIESTSETRFAVKVQRAVTRQQVQTHAAQTAALRPYQVGVSYEHTEVGGDCVTFDVTVTALTNQSANVNGTALSAHFGGLNCSLAVDEDAPTAAATRHETLSAATLLFCAILQFTRRTASH